MRNLKRGTIVGSSLLLFFTVFFGILLGFLLAETRNVMNTEQFVEFSQALPTQLLDINGEVITALASDEKRELVSINDLPQHVIDALITREDQIFYSHHGVKAKAIVRAILGVLTGQSLGGGSTLTQQIAGTLYADRTDISVSRKLKELFWAFQMERRYSKNEILELYLNRAYLGGGTYGVSAAAKYYFGHDVRDITPAEAAVLVILLSSPAEFNPFRYPNRARERQYNVLTQMVEIGYLDEEVAESSFDAFWNDFDYTRVESSAYFMREDKAPWFTAYVLKELEAMIYGTLDIYTGGFTVNTTLNLKHQELAQTLMSEKLTSVNKNYKAEKARRDNVALSTYIPLTELLALTFNLPQLKTSYERSKLDAHSVYRKEINPVIEVMSMMFGIEPLKVSVVDKSNEDTKKADSAGIEGTLISIENETGYITALVGGNEYSVDNQFIRATQALLQPGSAFKPLVYSAAIDEQKITAATVIDDLPTVFYNQGVPYIPTNYMHESEGRVLAWYALVRSMNVPAVKVLEKTGFDPIIDRAVALLGIPEEEIPSRNFERVFPLALGTASVRPIEVARAYSVFANLGRAVDPIAIRSVSDREGNVFFDPERELRIEQKNRGAGNQVISAQNAFIMTSILRRATDIGTLRGPTEFGSIFDYTDENGRKYRMPAAGKTGTTQNNVSAWTAGYTPHITTVVWFGFDSPKGGESLGVSNTGATLSGNVWAQYMAGVNKDYPYKDFEQPQSGLVQAEVCSASGQIPTDACGNEVVSLFFLSGTQPTELCTFHTNRTEAKNIGVQRLSTNRLSSGVETVTIEDDGLVLDLSFLEGDIKGISDKQKSKNPAENLEETQEKLEQPPEFNFLFD